MPVAGERPESGVRIVLERPRGDAPPWTYEGAAHLPDATLPLRAVVREDGQVEVELATEPGADDAASRSAPSLAALAEKVRLIVRTAHRQAKADDEAPPLRIVRWRGEK